MSQLKDLAAPFDDRLVQRKPGSSGGDYVSHSTVTERALSIVGPYSTEDVQLIRGYAAEEKTTKRTYPAQDGVVVGVLVTIRCVVDGREVRVTEAGDVENPLQKGNDGARAKDAISDAVKRCWMRLGLGLHLWSQEHYVLDRVLERNESVKEPPVSESVQSVQETPKEPVEAKTKPAQPTKRVEATPPAANPIWMGWRKSDDAVLWAGDQVDADGTELFGHLNHAQNSFTKAKDEYTNSLTDAEKPKPDDSHERKWAHARALFKYFYERTEAKKRGETLLLPTAGSQRIFEPFDANEAVGVEALSGD